MNFNKWLALNENLQIIQINPEEDWEEAEKAYQIATIVNIRPGRDKEPTIIAKNDQGKIIGAVFTSWSEDSEATQHFGTSIAKWDFDVVVHPHWQGYEMIGMKLIKQAELMRQSFEKEYGQKAYTRLWVVNPKLAKILQHPKYGGYEAESEYEDGSAHLVKY